jgi:hypothetical protein
MGILFLSSLGTSEFFILVVLLLALIAKVVYIVGLSKFKSSCIKNNIEIHPDFYPLILLVPLYSFFYDFTLLSNVNKSNRGSNYNIIIILKIVKIIEALCGLSLVFLKSLDYKILASLFVIFILTLIVKYILRLLLISKIKVEIN